MSEFVILHRIKSDYNTREILISVVPNESLMSTIGRIRPAANDEIVIKVVDDRIEANKEATAIINDMFASHEEQRKMDILTASPGYQDGPF